MAFTFQKVNKVKKSTSYGSDASGAVNDEQFSYQEAVQPGLI